VITGERLREQVAAYVDAINARDPVAIAARFTEDAVHADPVSNPPNRGRAAIIAFFEAGIGASEDWTFTATDIHTCADQVAMHFSIAVSTGGTTMTIDGIEVFAADDHGLFRSVHAYWDDADLTFG
jgi:steroid delta-isomerase